MTPTLALLAALVVGPISASVQAADPAAGSSDGPNSARQDDFRATPRLIAEHASLQRGGQSWIGVHFEIDEGWHTYWPGINDSGFPALFEFSTPEGVTVGEPLWPAPHRYPLEGGLLDHVYEDRVTVLYPVRVDAGFGGPSVTIEADGEWLVCEVECIPEFAALTMSINVADSQGDLSEDAGLFRTARARHALPWPTKDESGVELQWEGEAVAFLATGGRKLAFYPAEGSRSPRALLENGESEGGRIELEFKPSDKPVEGILEVWNSTGDGSSVYHVRTWPE